VLIRHAAETGGVFLEWREGNPAQAAGQLTDQMRAEYRLEFTPTELDGKRHSLKVEVKRKGVRVFLRRNFVAANSRPRAASRS
jgi:hypothetical protein